MSCCNLNRCLFDITRYILFSIVSIGFFVAQAQTTIFSENFEAASGAENQASPYLGWQNGAFDASTNDNYFWVFDNTRTTVISGNYSMAVSQNNPVNSSTTEYKTNKSASTFVYYTTPIDGTNYTNITLDFNWIGDGETIFDFGKVLYSLDGNTWTELATYEGQTTVQSVTNLDLSNVDQQSFYIGFGWENDGSIGNFPGFIVDDIFIKGTSLPACSAPTAQPTVLNLTAGGDTVSGSFTAASPVPDNYLVVISTSATAPTPVDGSSYNVGDTIGTSTVVDIDNNTNFTATGLSNSTTYYVYVFSFNSLCLGGPDYNITSPLSGSITTTNSIYCTPATTTTTTELYIDDVEFIGTLNDWSNLSNGTDFTSNGYSDYTVSNKSVQAQGEGINVYVGGTSRGHFKVWIDWDNDGLFADDATETVYDTGGIGTTTTTFGFIIPETQALGDYKLRIRFFNSNVGGIETYGTDFNSCEEFLFDSNGGGWRDDVTMYGEAEDYLFTVVEKCDMNIETITDGSSCGPGSVDLTVTGTVGVTEFKWYDSEIGGNLVATTSTGTWSPNIATTTTYWVTATDGNCESLERVKIVAKINAITELTLLPENPTICGDDDIIQISVTGETEISYLIDEDFEDGDLGVFTNVNYINNGATQNALSAWQNQVSTHVPPSSLVWKPAISSGFGSNKFVMSFSDINPSSGAVYESLESPLLDTTTFTDLTLTFDAYFSKYLTGSSWADDVFVYVSLDGGATWGVIYTINDDIGYGKNFQNISLDLSAYINNPNLMISFDYYAAWTDGVAIDNIKLFGSKPLNPSFTWTGTVDAYTDANATIPYVEGTEVASVYVKPTAAQILQSSFTFTANATLSNGCIVEKEIPITNNSKTWNSTGEIDWFDATKWLPVGEPDLTSCVIIHTEVDVPDTAPRTGFAKNVKVKSTGNLELKEGESLTITDWLKIEAGGVVNLRTGSNLVQGTDVTVNENTGDLNMERTVNGLNSSDYVFWSSPVDAFNVEDISSSVTGEAIYEWIPTVLNGPVDQYGNWQAALGNMSIGKGYIVRNLVTTSQPNTAIFSGVANNGIINVPIERGTYGTQAGENGYINPINGVTVLPADDNWNLIGNPYPSSISANSLTSYNSNIDGTIYLWTHQSAPSVDNEDPFYEDFVYNYSGSDYIEYNNTGSNPPGFGGYIASGQSFFVLMEDSAPQNDNVTFSNTMRRSTYDNSNFYGPNNNEQLEKHRVWLDLINADNLANSILIGYVDGATDNKDRLYDGLENAATDMSFYSLIGAEKMSIQGKALPFNDSDTVELGVLIPENGNYTIAINTLDGIFEQESQDVFIEDTYSNIIHNIKLSPYNFNSENGVFNDRFILRYTEDTLSLNDKTFNNDLTIIVFDNTLKVQSNLTQIESIKLFDIQGRLVSYIPNINQMDFRSNQLNFSSGNYLVSVTLRNGQVITKKIVF